MEKPGNARLSKTEPFRTFSISFSPPGKLLVQIDVTQKNKSKNSPEAVETTKENPKRSKIGRATARQVLIQ
jgi:uncharacterized membrane-anchored protein